MTSTTTTALLSGFVSCVFATGTIAQQIPSGMTSVKPSSPKAAPSQPAPPKSWERSVVRMSLPMRPTQLKFSEDGETLFTNGATEQSAELWSLTTGKRLSAFPAKPGFTFCDIALSPDGQFAAALMYSHEVPAPLTKRKVELKVWNLKTEESRWTIPFQDHAVQTTETPVCQVEFSPNSHLLATSISSRSNQLQPGVRIWNVPQGTLQQVTGSAVTYINRLAFNLDSSVLGFITVVNDKSQPHFVSDKSQLHLWNLNTRKLQAKVQAVQGNYVLPIVDIVFSPNQQDVIAFTSYGGPSSYIYRWQIKTGKLQLSSELPIDRTDSLLALSPDGQTFVYGGDVMGYHIGNFQTNQRQRFPLDPAPGSRLTKVVFSPDGQQMAIDRNGQTIEVIR